MQGILANCVFVTLDSDRKTTKYTSKTMKRDLLIEQIADADKVWDVVVVGGGATGLGCAVDAAMRGFSVALFEQNDFAKCT